MVLLDLSEADNYTIREEGNKKICVVDCRNCIWGRSVADYPACMRCAVNKQSKTNTDMHVLMDVYERLYDEPQTQLIKDLARSYKQLEDAKVWSYSNLGLPRQKTGRREDTELSQRHNVMVKLAYEQARSDPVSAYVGALQTLQREQIRLGSQAAIAQQDIAIYVKSLIFLIRTLEGVPIVQKSKPYLDQLGKDFDTRRLYHSFFEPQVKPAFIGSRLLYGEAENLQLIDEYMVDDTPVQIYQPGDRLEMLYYVNPPEYTLSPDKYFILTRTKDIVSAFKPEKNELSDVSTSRDYFERIYTSTIEDVAAENGMQMSEKEKESLARLVARYTVGYGTLEILLKDRRLTDIYLDAPLGLKPVYVVHSDYEQCQTNVLFTSNEAKSLVSRFRALSGRPFDEAHPILDYDLQDMHARLAVIGEPLSPYGTALVFRLHKETPWTLPQEIDLKMLTKEAAGALSFFIDAQASTIVTGSRGSGKTSLMTALMLEIPQNLRVLIQEDTMELPVMEMKTLGFNILRMKTRSAIASSTTEAEVPAEDALRTALRLGDSVLIVGEVRSTEAKVLYEAMRVGAVGNVVMGTIHGENAYSVWDRVVNDLGVPNTSFKATDLVVAAAPIRFGGSLKRHRRLIQVTEIGKDWTEDPQKEGGLNDLFVFDGKKDTLELNQKNWDNSVFLKKISKLRGLKLDDMWNEVEARAETKGWMVDMKNKFQLPDLLEGRMTVPAHNKYLMLSERSRQEYGAVDYKEVLTEWKKWVEEAQLKPLVAQKKAE